MSGADPEIVPGLASVIVPAYQAERYLREALDSAFAQDYDAFEVIVVDDGSSDRTAEIAASYPVQLLRRSHRGPAAARNCGIAASRGEFVTVLDSDDIWPTDRLSRQIGYLQGHPQTGIVLGHTRFFVNPGEPRPAHHPKLDGDTAPGHASTMLARRAVFERIVVFDESLWLGEDIDWLARAKDAGVISATLEDVVLRYRVHATNTSRFTSANQAAMLGILRESVRRQRGESGG
ncbi:MAG TPA: glycosyltransferase family A protein [Solirubrobacteraceae bacterium]